MGVEILAFSTMVLSFFIPIIIFAPKKKTGAPPFFIGHQLRMGLRQLSRLVIPTSSSAKMPCCFLEFMSTYSLLMCRCLYSRPWARSFWAQVFPLASLRLKNVFPAFFFSMLYWAAFMCSSISLEGVFKVTWHFPALWQPSLSCNFPQEFSWVPREKETRSSYPNIKI